MSGGRGGSSAAGTVLWCSVESEGPGAPSSSSGSSGGGSSGRGGCFSGDEVRESQPNDNLKKQHQGHSRYDQVPGA